MAAAGATVRVIQVAGETVTAAAADGETAMAAAGETVRVIQVAGTTEREDDDD